MKKTAAIIAIITLTLILALTACSTGKNNDENTTTTAVETTVTNDIKDTENDETAENTEIRWETFERTNIIEQYKNCIDAKTSSEDFNQAEKEFLLNNDLLGMWGRDAYDDYGERCYDIFFVDCEGNKGIVYTNHLGEVIFQYDSVGYLHRPAELQEDNEKVIYETNNQTVVMSDNELVWYQYGAEVDRVGIKGEYIGIARGLVFRDKTDLYLVSIDGIYPDYSTPDHTPKKICEGVKKVLSLRYSWKCDFSGILLEMEDGTQKVYVYHGGRLEDPEYEGGYTDWRW